MHFAININAHKFIKGITHFYSRRLLSTFVSKRTIVPFIRIIHPDSYANETLEIQQINMKCLQCLNELWDCLENIHKEMESARDREFNLVSVLKSTYDLSCAIRTSNDSPIQNFKLSVISPAPLCRRGQISCKKASAAQNQIFTQLGNIHQIIGLESPWPTFRTAPDDTESITAPNMMDRLNTALFERVVTINHQRARQTGPIFSNNNTSNAYAVNTHDRLHNKLGKKQLAASISEFISSGHNFFVRDLTSLQEVEGIKRFEEFLLEFGPTIGFSPYIWRHVIVILYDGSSAVHDTVPGSRQARSQAMYKCDKTSSQGKYILEIPVTFKDRMLINFLQDELPMSNMSGLMADS